MVAGQVSEFELHDMTTKLAIIYKRMLEYLELQLFAEHDRLRVINLQNLKIIVKQALAYEAVLNGFAIQK